MSEPARVVGHISPEMPWGEQESPIDRVAQAAATAIDDLNAVIWTATSRRELVLLRELAEALTTQLDASRATALTLDEWFYEMRGRQE